MLIILKLKYKAIVKNNVEFDGKIFEKMLRNIEKNIRRTKTISSKKKLK